jgi:catechol 2,3-dioxygenase-like lactoylglutathione lyase family enzyme
MLNIETIVHPKLQHFGLLTGNLQRLLDWYQKVLGMRTIHESENPTDAPAGTPASRLKAAFISNDEMSHRVAVIEVPGLTTDPERSKHRRLQHVAFEFGTLDELLGSYARLKALGIVPQFSVDEGPQTGFYYEDPDGKQRRDQCLQLPGTLGRDRAYANLTRFRPPTARSICRSRQDDSCARGGRHAVGAA